MFTKVWEANYQGHTIRVENRMFSETMWIDGQIADQKKFSLVSAVLHGTISNAGGASESVVAFLFPRGLTVDCAIVMGRELPATLVKK